MSRVQNMRPQPIKIGPLTNSAKLSQLNVNSTKSNATNCTSFSNLISFSENNSPMRKKSTVSLVFQQVEPLQKQCRICLDSEEDALVGKILIAPCKCTGSVRYVHATCLIEWLKRNMSASELSKLSQKKVHGVECQMCKSTLRYQVLRNNVCLSLEQTKQKIQVSPSLFSLLIILFFSMVAGSIIIICLLSTKQADNQNGNYTLQHLIQISALIVLVISLSICLYFIITIYFRATSKDIILCLSASNKIKQKRNKEFTMATIHPLIPQAQET